MLDHKPQGELAELCFLCRATTLGLTVSKPYGDSARYDFVVDAGAGLLRVQVKSVSVMRRNDYRIAASSGSRLKRGYSAAEIDFLAAYVIPCDAWYIIPVSAFDSIVSLNVAPHRPAKGRFEQYREAWHLLRPARVAQSLACPERSRRALVREGGAGPSGLQQNINVRELSS